jgi:hypothetical protein
MVLPANVVGTPNRSPNSPLIGDATADAPRSGHGHPFRDHPTPGLSRGDEEHEQQPVIPLTDRQGIDLSRDFHPQCLQEFALWEKRFLLR